MTTFENNVITIVQEVYKPTLKQAAIDLIEWHILPLIHRDEPLNADDIGYATGLTRRLLEVYNPIFEADVTALQRLYTALNEWRLDVENTNTILGLPKCS